jgi:predicted DNA-binding transcriptional regulator AlpA
LINDQGMDERLLPAPAAAHRIGVKRDTLYAYVSRGRLTVHRRAGHRGSWFDPVELDALVRRAREPAERRPEIRITSAITLIEHGHYWYRGRGPGPTTSTHGAGRSMTKRWAPRAPPRMSSREPCRRLIGSA